MQRLVFKPLHLAVVAVCIAAAPHADSAMYKWADEEGIVTYSSKPPADPKAVKELTVVEGLNSAADSDTPAKATLEATPVRSESATGGADPRALMGHEPDAVKQEPDSPPRVTVRPDLPEAVQDPCLRSSDPRCPEKYRDYYVPGRGFSPSAARAIRAGSTEASATGSSVTAGGGGAVSGGAQPARSIIPPPRRAQGERKDTK